jgi:hypothetical protein
VGFEPNHTLIATPRSAIFRERISNRSNFHERPERLYRRANAAGCESKLAVARLLVAMLENNIESDSTHADKATILVPADSIAPSGKPSRARLAVAFAVAAVSDFISFLTVSAPPLQWAIDGGTALLLFLILGRRWALLPGLIAEAVPGLGMFPFWVLVVLSIAIYDGIKKPLKSPPHP